MHIYIYVYMWPLRGLRALHSTELLSAPLPPAIAAMRHAARAATGEDSRTDDVTQENVEGAVMKLTSAQATISLSGLRFELQEKVGVNLEARRPEIRQMAESAVEGLCMTQRAPGAHCCSLSFMISTPQNLPSGSGKRFVGNRMTTAMRSQTIACRCKQLQIWSQRSDVACWFPDLQGTLQSAIFCGPRRSAASVMLMPKLASLGRQSHPEGRRIAFDWAFLRGLHAWQFTASTSLLLGWFQHLRCDGLGACNRASAATALHP